MIEDILALLRDGSILRWLYYLLKDCLPHGKNIFAEDIVRNIELDLPKLNNILMMNYFVGPVAKFTIEKMTVSRFKKYLCYLLSK